MFGDCCLVALIFLLASFEIDGSSGVGLSLETLDKTESADVCGAGKAIGADCSSFLQKTIKVSVGQSFAATMLSLRQSSGVGDPPQLQYHQKQASHSPNSLSPEGKEVQERGGDKLKVLCVIVLGCTIVLSAVALLAPTLVSVNSLSLLQSVALLKNLLENMTISSIVTDCAELLEHLGSTVLASGFLIGCPMALFAVGAIGGYAFLDGVSSARQRLIFSCAFICSSFCCACYGFSALPPPHWLHADTGTRTSGLFISRILFGLAAGLPSYSLDMMARNTTPRSEQAQFGVLSSSCRTAGIGFGPLVGSLAGFFLGADASVEVKAAGTQVILCGSWFVLAAWSIAAVPSDLGQLLSEKSCADGPEEIKGQPQDTQNTLHDDRKRIWIKGFVYTLERAFTVSSIEAATAIILEEEFGWSREVTGLAISLTFIAGLPFLLSLNKLRQDGYLCDLTVMVVGSAVCAFASLWMMPGLGRILGLGHSAEGWILLVADATIFSGVYFVGGLVDAQIVNSTAPGTLYSLENFWICRLVLISTVGRVLGPALARGLLEMFGRWAYSSVQVMISMLGLFTVLSLCSSVCKA